MPSISFTLPRRSFHFKNSGEPYGKVTGCAPVITPPAPRPRAILNPSGRSRPPFTRNDNVEKAPFATRLRARRDRGPGARRSAAHLPVHRHRHGAVAPVVERPGLERRAG